MEKGIFVALAAVLLMVAAFVSFLLLRGPPLYRRAQNGMSYPRNEKVASRLLVLTLVLGALVTLGIAAWAVL